MFRKIVKGLLTFKLLLLLILGASIWSTRIPDVAYHTVDANTAKQDFHVIEFNDDGEMHDAAQWQALRDRITQADTAPELLIFIHGWHHSAASDDENYVAFKAFYEKMAQQKPKGELLGLYIGWRGDQYDPFWLDGSTDPSSLVEALDFPTIISRRIVAERVGENGVASLLDNLELLTDDHALQRYVVVGHSLGGAIGLYASKNRIKTQLIEHKPSPNLVVLLNPAVTTNTYKPLDEWVSAEGDKPRMLVLQSKGDYAVKKAFNWLKEGERALGNSWAITHDIDLCPGNDCTRQIKLPQALVTHDATPGCMMVLPNTGWKIRARLHARRTVKTCIDANQQAVWVLAVSDDIINGHNGILTGQHAIALAETMTMFDLHPAPMQLARDQ